ncbi:MAG: CHAT domain-containing tetratricopeptide repeat protein [Acidobacteriota bacterium]
MKITIITLLFFLLLPQQSVQELGTLENGAVVKHDIAENEIYAYRLPLEANQYLRVTVKQLKIDLVVTLRDPQGNVVLQSDVAAGLVEVERIAVVTQTAGVYQLEIRTAKGASAKGAFEITVADIHPATATDLKFVTAERLYEEAERLRVKGDAASLGNALEKYQQYLALARELGDAQAQASTHQMISIVYRLLGDSANALEHLNLSLPLIRSTSNRMIEAGILNSIGNLYAFQGDAPKSVDYYLQAIALLHQLGAKLQESSLLHNLGGVYLQIGEIEKAFTSLEQALAIRRAAGDVRGEANTVNALGQAYGASSDYAKTEEYLQQALPLARKVNDRRLEAAIFNNLAVVYKEAGQYQQALQSCQQALDIYATVIDRRLEIIALNNLGLIYLQMNDYQKAQEAFDKAHQLSVASQDALGDAKALANLGLIYAAQGKPDEALKTLRQALTIQQTIKSRTDEAFTLKGIAEVERSLGNLSAARLAMESAIEIIESVRSRINNQDIQTAFFSSKREFYETLTDILMQMHTAEPANNYQAAALQTSERGKARGLLDMLTEARVQFTQGVDATLITRRAAIQKELNAKEQYRIRLLAGKHTNTQVEIVEKELRQLLGDFQEVRAKIRATNPRYAAMMQPQPLTLAEIQQQVLDKDTLLLEYSLGKDRSYLWAVTTNSIRSFTLPSRFEIESKAKRIYELLTARNRNIANESIEQKLMRVKLADEAFRKEAAELSRMILAPAASLFANKRLLIVGEGWLQYLPFAALPKPTSQNPLIVENEIVTLPSSSVLTAMRRDSAETTATRKTLAIFADPVFSTEDMRVKQLAAKKASAETLTNTLALRSGNDAGLSNFYRLPSSRQEAEAIIEVVPQSQRLAALDFAANKPLALSESLTQYRIIHFATHALLNGKTPELSGIVLSLTDEAGKSVDGFLRLHEIYNLQLNADLVVLSGCKTALGKDVKGEGLIGLTRGFMYAGARSVVASLWSVEDRATAELMKQFYKAYLGNQLTTAAALRAAQVEMIKAKKAPYYWAAFTLQGEWR